MTWILPKQLHTLDSALDTEALSLDFNEQSQVCAQSLFVRSKPSQSRIWSAKWKRDSWTQHLSGRILRPSLGNRFVTEWTSSLGDIPASPSAQQGSAEARTTQGTCGPISQMAFDFSDLGSASLRTSKDISAWGCPTSSKTWQEWVIERRGAYSARLKSAHHTNASGCSSWPTVRHEENWQGHGSTQSYAENGANKQVNYRYNKQGEKVFLRKGTFDTTLTTAVIAQNWPSPVASEVRQGFQDRSRGMKGSQESLTTVVIKQHGPAVPMSWPTPRTNDDTAGRPNDGTARVGPNGQRYGINLSDKVLHGHPVPASSSTDGSRPESWATPRAGKTTDENPETWAKRQAKGDVATMPLTAQVKTWQTATVSTGANRQKDGSMTDKLDQQVKNWSNGKLNPRWVETLMGLPVGWTMPSCASPVTIERMSSDSSVTVLSQQQQNERSEH